MNDAPPIFEELIPPPDPWAACQSVDVLPGCLLFDSALKRDTLGRYSFLTADPVDRFVLTQATTGINPFAPLEAVWNAHQRPHIDDLPPFQGGLAGVLSYELNRCWERIRPASNDEFELPLLAVGLYDWVIAWDHQQNRAWILAHDIGGKFAGERIAEIRGLISGDQPKQPSNPPQIRFQLIAPKPLPNLGLPNLSTNFTEHEYLATVERIIEFIRAGDIFQANLSQRLLHPLELSPQTLYSRLRKINSATFGAYFAWDDWHVLSASPERFLRLRNREVETRPIKGTRRRGVSPEAELFTRDELRQSEKDMAENVMIVDLLRNDLSRVCRPGTVFAPELCIVETYETVQHLVSEIRGTLRDDISPFELLAATFPGGSITGAPKVRAMDIISQLEPTVRGHYCGSLFYIGFDGWMDSNILIRTFTTRRGWVQCSVGGGIVAQSDPRAEYKETLHKARGMLDALRSNDLDEKHDPIDRQL